MTSGGSFFIILTLISFSPFHESLVISRNVDRVAMEKQLSMTYNDDLTTTIITQKDEAKIRDPQNFTTTGVLALTRELNFVCPEINNPWIDENYNGDYGNEVHIDNNCGYWGGDFYSVKTLRDSCAGLCLQDTKCTHFEWGWNGLCFLKNFNNKKAEKTGNDFKGNCGYVTQYSGLDWKDGRSSQVKTYDNCGFWGGDYRSLESKKEDCAGQCTSDPKCTHFDWGWLGKCFLKNFSGKKADKVAANGYTGICGEVIGYTGFTLNGGNNDQVRWADNCDFWGNDIRSFESKKEDCPAQCVSDPNCTNFTWGWMGKCFLKNGKNPELKEVKKYDYQGYCGWINGRI